MENAKKIIEHAKSILMECEKRGYSNSEVTLLIVKMDQLKKEAVCKDSFHTHSFDESYFSNSSHK